MQSISAYSQWDRLFFPLRQTSGKYLKNHLKVWSSFCSTKLDSNLTQDLKGTTLCAPDDFLHLHLSVKACLVGWLIPPGKWNDGVRWLFSVVSLELNIKSFTTSFPPLLLCFPDRVCLYHILNFFFDLFPSFLVVRESGLGSCLPAATVKPIKALFHFHHEELDF